MTDSNRGSGDGTAKLTLVSDLAPLYDLGRKPETTAERVRRLQAEAQLLAREQVEALNLQLEAAIAVAADIVRGGEAYPVGIREQADRLVHDLEARVQGFRVIMSRAPEPKI